MTYMAFGTFLGSPLLEMENCPQTSIASCGSMFDKLPGISGIDIFTGLGGGL